ncbi:hypothetical protein SHLO109777_12930 [Shewanella loihica]|uniref:Uncharacterized protein n=2 Tax=Shewanella TaxID=22 RepID=A3QA02_SHELP|nr:MULTISPECIES: hypothetical protein [Shewanella]ABO22300.1 conserved hypothetical protein [Shewanella loihica PV-4]ASJ95471.1 hypothetical protein CFF01_02085 [Shewanella marisflavi]MCG9713064.1 hypothetical protein [Shewanella insulae]MCG9720321.1 hypothetical protein [Shewanella sp. Isolate7]MCG9739769.1 hypothetical protein [Shewanella insulae]
MAQLLDVIPNDAEIEAITAPKNPKAACELQHRREVKRRLEELLEEAALKRAMGGDFY